MSDHPPADDKGPAFLQRFLAAQRRLYAYIYTLHPYRRDADDLLQEVSAVMWLKFDPARPPDDFVAWGCRIAHLTILDYRKRSRRSRVLFSQDLLDRLAATSAERAADPRAEDRAEALAGCVGKLPARDRELLELRFAEGATTVSTAQAVGRSAEAVYKALARIRRALAECVSRTLAAGGEA